MKRKHKRKLRPQAKRILVLILLFLAIILVKGITAPAEAKAETKEEYITYIVQPKDKLWKIALKYKKAGEDTREKIFEIEQLNQDKDLSTIYPGEEITIKIEP